MRVKQSETAVTTDITNWLRRQGWIVRRQHVGVFYTAAGNQIRMGDTGACDWWAVRPVTAGYADYIEIEVKATGRKPPKEQREYMARRKHQGVVCIWADSLEMFKTKFAEAFGEYRADT